MTRRVSVFTAFALLIGAAACAFNAEEEPPTPDPIPAGAQQVHITVTPRTQNSNAPRLSDIELAPDTVRAGDVYLVINDGVVGFVERQPASDATPGPLTDGQIAGIIDASSRCPRGNASCLHAYAERHGDVMKHTVVSELEAGYCDPRDDPRPGVRGGSHCKVMLVQLQPGRYLIVVGALPVGGAAVLTVTP